jgi:uncharacterized membrane protein
MKKTISIWQIIVAIILIGIGIGIGLLLANNDDLPEKLKTDGLALVVDF